jgi:glycosyltransferase involved in cell wall biosynthesis
MLLPTTIHYHDRKKFEFHCIYFLPHKDQVVPLLEKEQVSVKCIAAKSNLQIFWKQGILVDYIKSNNIDLVHAHLPWGGIVGSMAAKRAGIPVVYTEHNNVNRYHKMTQWMNRRAYQRYDRVIAVSQDCQQAATAQFSGLMPCPITTIYNGVNTDYFKKGIEKHDFKEFCAIPNDSLVITNVAQYRDQKRLDRWLRIVKTFSDLQPDARFVLIGFGLKQEMVEELVREYQLEDKLIRPGLQQNIQEWLSISDIFLMSSDWEGLPIALLEAMSMGCVPVVTDAGGIPEVVNDDCGFVYAKDDVSSAVNALQLLYNNRELLNRLSNEARARVVEQFDIRKMVCELEGVYKEVLGRG